MQIINWVNEYKDAREENPYYVSAIVEKGGATVVVVRDTYNSYNPGTGDDKNKEFTSNGITLVVSENVKASNFAAVIDSSGKLTFQFDTDMGAAANTTFSYSYTIKNADGVVIDKRDNLTSDRVAPQFKDDITHIMLQDGKEYTLTITDVVPTAYKMTVDSTADGITKDDVSVNSGATSLTSAAQDITLKIPSSKITATEFVNVTFAITGVDTKALTKATDVTGQDGIYTVKVDPADLNRGVKVLENVKATGEVKFTVTSVADASSTVAWTLKLAAGSEKYATLAGTASGTANVGDTVINLGTDQILALPASTVTGADFVIKATGAPATTPAAVQANGGTNKLGNVTIGAAQVGTPIVIEIEVIPNEYTLAAARFNLLSDKSGATMATNVVFDGEGNVKAGDLVTSLGATDSYEVTINGEAGKLMTAASNKITVAAGDFKIDPAILVDTTKRIEIKVLEAYKITGDGVQTGEYVLKGETYTLPAKGADMKGTGMNGHRQLQGVWR